MEHATIRNYIRKTAIEDVRYLLKNLPQHQKHPIDAIRMIDRCIGGLLAHKESPSYQGYRDYATALFPSGLENTLPNKDIILILNSNQSSITKAGHKCDIKIPTLLKHPEKGVAQIIGPIFARTLFGVRESVLKQLIAIQEKDADWRANLEANNAALAVLKNYNPYQADIDKLLPRKISWLDHLFPSIRVSADEVTQSKTPSLTP